MHYSVDGFRVPAADNGGAPRRRPFVLALGCSFTYGDGCVAKDTYVSLVAEKLAGTALNAGKCAYGLAQMLVLARELIPRYKPEYVLVQFSPWLAGRATDGFARSAFGRVPTPFLTLRADRKVTVHPPAYPSRVFALPFADYDNNEPGQFGSFAWRAGVPLFLYDDLQVAAYHVRRSLGTWPTADWDRALADPEGLNRVVYHEIEHIAEENGSRMILVRLSHPLQSHWQNPRDAVSRALVVDAQAAIDAKVRSRDQNEYQRRFAHWRGKPPVLVDTHPNPSAHGIAATEILRELRRH